MPKNEKELKDLMTKIVAQVLPEILRQQSNNVRSGIVISVQNTTRTASIKLDSTGQVLDNIKFQRGASALVNDRCLLISPDPNLRGQVNAIIF